MQRLEFIRVLRDDEITVLKMSRGHEDRHFNRFAGSRYDKQIEQLARASEFFPRDKDTHKGVIEALEDINRFMRGKSELNGLLNHLNYANGSLPYLSSVYEHITRRLKFIQRRAEELGGYAMKPVQVEEFRTSLTRLQEPSYCFFGSDYLRAGFSDKKIERIARALQGIISIKMGNYGNYRDIFVPKKVYEQSVIPALKDSKHRFVVELEEEKLVAVLMHTFEKNRNLRKRFGNGFRVEFTRPEICEEVLKVKMPALKEFTEFMRPLEGILGRIERRACFQDEKWKSEWKEGWTVSYDSPSWFLPLYHQRLLEVDLVA